MAAQKLTKGRLIQILVMLAILIVAFTWRSFQDVPIEQQDCSARTNCTVIFANERIDLISVEDDIFVTLSPEAQVKILSAHSKSKDKDQDLTRFIVKFKEDQPRLILLEANNKQLMINY